MNLLNALDGRDVLVHTAFSHVRWPGGPGAFVQALADAVGPNGTVLFPTLSDTPFPEVKDPPAFRVTDAPAPWVGVVPSVALARADAVRSLHPTHSVAAIGALSHWYTAGHHLCDTPCGLGSPYFKLAQRKGLILLAGCDHESNTSLHMAEELAGSGYHLLPGIAQCPIQDSQGRRLVASTRLHRWGIPRKFGVLEPELDALGLQVRGSVGQGDGRVIRADRLLSFVLWKLGLQPDVLLSGCV